MSRIGKQPIRAHAASTSDRARASCASRARKGELSQGASRATSRSSRRTAARSSSARPTAASTARSTGSPAVADLQHGQGVTEGFEKRLEIQGVGYRAQLEGNALELALGFSHPVQIEAPEGIEFEVPAPTQIIVRGIDKQAGRRDRRADPQVRPPEPYKGKGIRYAGEYVARKVGKRA